MAEIKVAEDGFCKSVQDLYESSQQVPDEYMYKDDIGIQSETVQQVEIPIIDLDLLTNPTAASGELEKLHLALSSWGCFQAINHGVPNSFLDKVRGISKQFFELPMEEKRKYGREDNGIEGYGNDMVLSDKQVLDWNDRLYLLVHPEDDRKLKYWPECPEEFRQILEQYTGRLRFLTQVILKAMARSLNLEEDCFLLQYGERCLMFSRFNRYPPCPRPEHVLGLKPHADGSAMTFLLQDPEVEGLQLLRDNQWFKVPILPHALVVNVGDQIEIMSNGVFKSPVHRAVANSEKVRSSIAMFCCPDRENEVEPIDKLVSESRPRQYKMVKNYAGTYFKYYQEGKRPLDAVKMSSSHNTC